MGLSCRKDSSGSHRTGEDGELYTSLPVSVCLSRRKVCVRACVFCLNEVQNQIPEHNRMIFTRCSSGSCARVNHDLGNQGRRLKIEST
jgi:hypothetical protein